MENPSTATAYFIARKDEIDQLLARIAAKSANHFHTDPNAIHWGDTGSLDHAAHTLRELAAFLAC